MFDLIFQALFKYRPVIFEQGEFRFDPHAGSYVAAVLGAAVVAAAAFSYRQVEGRSRPRDRAVLLALRAAALALVLFCLFRPIIVVRAAVPQQNVLAVLLDDSRSMQVADWNGQPRGAFVREQFGGADSPIVKALSERFLIRTFRFSSSSSRLGNAGELTFTGGHSRLGAALDTARHELAGLPVSGMVLVSDGADTSETALGDALLGLKAEKLPVFTVGVGRDALARDVQLDRVTTPRSVLVGTSLLVDAVIVHTGYAGNTVTVDVEDEGRIVGSQQVRLPADGGPATVRMRAMASEPGPRVFRFRVSSQAGELITQNNVREVTIDVRDSREKILYFEGEPRFEMKFIRRAVTEDKNLEVVALQRTADNKYFRMFGEEPEDPDELRGGFPKTREELFKYRGLILGSVEAGAFTGDQLRMIADFVDKRGGGLLVTGGARSFGEGGYAGTPVADVLPLVVGAPSGTGLSRIKVTPTRAGNEHAVTQVRETEAASVARWNELPMVTSVNFLTAVKPGATVLLNGTDERGRSQVVLASQRYGRGKALALTIQDSWIWQMHATIPLEDQTHEHFWRQLLRWLVDGVPSQLDVRAPDRVDPGDPVTLEALLVDPTFVELNDARVVATIVPPGGNSFEIPLQWTGDQAGQYRGTFTAVDGGRYEVNVAAERAGKPIAAGAAHIRANQGDAEYFDATMHAGVMKRIAEDTGGRFYTPENAGGLAEDVRYAGRGVTTVEERDLWHMPIVLLALLGIVCAEWGYRRATGLA